MFNLGGWEIAVLAIAGLLFFGPNKLPQIMKQAGKIMREIKKASAEFQYSVERELEEDEYKRAHRRQAKKRKKMIERGLDPDAPAATAAPAGAVPVANAASGAAAPANGADAGSTPTAPATAAPASDAANTILPPTAEPAPVTQTKTGS
ncbi:MAG TPA: twin-arginine translocase TatA/TatE family subunit [bacterium]|nr:twin-arginine translocase TatA/TatE family subunit [bacterium]